MTTPPQTFRHDPAVIAVLKQIKDRCDGLKLEKKERDADALAFLLGAASGMLAVGDKRGNVCLKLGSLVVALQGYHAIEAILERENGEEPRTGDDHGKGRKRKRS